MAKQVVEVPSEVEVLDILKQVVLLGSSEFANRGYIPQARAYARAAFDYSMVGEELRVQCTYVWSNLASWTGDEARVQKARLRAFSQQKPQVVPQPRKRGGVKV